MLEGSAGDQRLQDTVVPAAPVLANLRNLAIAELRAATDSLTVNDTYGHGRGDDVLAAVGAVLREALHDSDLIGRMDGRHLSSPDARRRAILHPRQLVRRLRAAGAPYTDAQP